MINMFTISSIQLSQIFIDKILELIDRFKDDKT
jgi:hypothetical protein